MGKNMNNKEIVEGTVVLFGECAKNVLQGTPIKGCPPSSKGYKYQN